MPVHNLKKKIDGLKRVDPTSRRFSRKSLLMKIIITLVILFVVVYLPARVIYISSKALMQNSKQLAAALKTENLDQMKQSMGVTKASVKDLNNSLNWMFWVGYIPYFGGYYSDLQHFGKAGQYELEAAETITTSLEPYKNELGLTGQATPGQDRIVQVVKILDKTIPNMDKIEPSLKKAREEVETVDTGKYPEKFGSQPLRNLMETAKNFIIGADVMVSENRPLIEKAPDALGASQPKTYLLLFQNDKELRPTGGFITAYAFLRLDKGRLSTTSSDDIYRLDEQLLKVCLNKICPLTPPTPIVKYLPETSGKARTAWSMRDSNLSPDLPTSLKDFERMYNMLSTGNSFDGIITIDTQVVEELIAVTGSVDVFGTNYSAETDKRCNCPNVIYELEHYAEISSKGEADRKAVVGALMQQLLAKVLGAGPTKMPEFINAAVTLAGDKHIMFYMHDQKLQDSLSKLNWTGEIKQADGDYLHINDSNFAGGKSNLYVDEKVTYDIKVGNDGIVSNKVTIEYKNPQPFNIWLNGILRDYVRLYAPLGSKLTNSKGSEPSDPVTSHDDDKLGKTYFEAFVTVRPQNSRVLSFEYTSARKVTDKKLKLLIQKQPGAKDHHYIIKINGNKKAEFDLTTDKEINLSF